MADLIHRNDSMRPQRESLQGLHEEVSTSASKESVNPFSKDTLANDARKAKPLGSQVITPPGVYSPDASASQIDASAHSQPNPELTSVLDRISSWWSGEDVQTEENQSTQVEPASVAPVEETTQESSQTSYYDGLSSWAGSVWSYLTGFVSGETATQRIDDASAAKILAPMSPEERAELNRLMLVFNKIMARIKEELSEADLEYLMETMLMLAQQGKTDEFNLKKAIVIKKHEKLKDEQLKRLKDLDLYMDELRRNKLWNRFEEVTSSAGLIGAMAMAGPAWAVTAVLYSLGKFANAYANDPIERGLGRAIAWTGVGGLFGAKKRDTEQTAYNLIKFGFGIATTIGSYALGFGPTNTVMTMQSVVTIGRGIVQQRADSKQGEMEFQGFKVKEAQQAITKAQNELTTTQKESTQLWKLAGRHARTNNEAVRSMNQ